MANAFDQFDAPTQANAFDQFDPASAPQSAAPSALATVASGLVRPAIQALWALPGAAADAGVAVRNLMIDPTGRTQQYESPSHMLGSVLNQYTVAPATPQAKMAELASSILLGSRLPAPGIDNPAPSSFIAPLPAARNAAVSQAQDAGYIVPPAQGNPTLANRFMDWWGGKRNIVDEATIANQANTQRLNAEDLEVNPNSVVTRGSLDEIRSQAFANGYEPVRQFGQMTGDQSLNDTVDSLVAGTKGASASFPLTKADPKLDTAVSELNALKVPSFNSADAIDQIRYLRSQADDAFNGGQPTAGRLFKGGAKALEDAVDRNLSNAGQDGQGMLDAYRSARQLIAKTYTTQKAFADEFGTINASSYGARLAAGKPLEGNQLTIGEFARNFRNMSSAPRPIDTSKSQVDLFGPLIAAGATGSPAPLAIPITREAVKRYLLSPAGQARALAPMAGEAPMNIGLAGAFTPAFNSWLGTGR